MKRALLAHLLAIAICAAARSTHALPLDVGSLWIRVDDTAGYPLGVTGEVSYPGVLAFLSPFSITGLIQTFSAGPPGFGYGYFASTQRADNPTDLQFGISSGTYVYNLSADASFVGTVTSFGGTLAGIVPANATFTTDGTVYQVASIPGVPACDPPPPGYRCFMGTTAFNQFQNITTPASSPPGTPVTVSASTTYYNSLTGLTVPISTDVTFKGGIAPGGATTTFATVSNESGHLGSNFAGAVGSFRAQYTDVVVAPPGAYTGPVIVCSTFDGANGILAGTDISVCDLRILHKEGSDFVDRTLDLVAADCPLTPSTPCPGASRCIDPGLSRICGRTASLSFFTVAPFVGDSDGDGLAENDDPCTRVTAGQAAAKAKVVTKHIDLPLGQQAITWKGSFDPNTYFASTLAVATTGVHLRLDSCLSPPSAAGFPIDVDVPGGLVGQGCNVRDGWKVGFVGGGNSDWTYVNKSGFLDAACSVSAHGITKVVVKDRRIRGQGVKFAVTAKDVSSLPLFTSAPGCRLYGAIALAPRLPGSVASPEALSGQCGEFWWTAPAATARPAPYCKTRPLAVPTTETCVGP